MLVKAGVDISRLKRKIRKSLCVVEQIFTKYGIEMVITSTYEGSHSACSYHYGNDAYDIRWRNNYPRQIITEIREKLGSDYDVILERNHIHIEYDPKKKESHE